ncbi:hypothetical protein [Candidatus Blastococcus massiliensis]|uniref:hypothetical protein n=1 Tax=Candidatus Blastococcus massiliensis TaxID=1470358 RepID=UPI00058E7276|nr:hypothetical protein [Candidatus Blastococcus massiliensis]
MPLQLTASYSPTLVSPTWPQQQRPVLTVILDRDDVELTLPAAIESATPEGRRLCVAIIRPRPRWSRDAVRYARRTEESDRQIVDLLHLVTTKTARVSGKSIIGVHLIAGLRGRCRAKVLERAARRYDAQPLGTEAT